MNDAAMIAERYGITEKCASLERDLLGIDGVTSVEFDLNGFLDDIHQVIVLVGYDFHIVTRKLRLAVDVVNTAYLHGLEESGDRIEDSVSTCTSFSTAARAGRRKERLKHERL